MTGSQLPDDYRDLFEEHGGNGMLLAIGYIKLTNHDEGGTWNDTWVMVQRATRLNQEAQSGDPDGWWEIPAACVDGNETKQFAAIRELLGEAGQLDYPEFFWHGKPFRPDSRSKAVSVFAFELTIEQVHAVYRSSTLSIAPWSNAITDWCARDALSLAAIARFIVERPDLPWGP